MIKLPFKMTNRIRAALTLACVVAAWFVATPSDTWHYRITVTLQTPDGPKSGTTVRAVTMHPGIGLTGLPPSFDLKGEAVAIEAAPGSYVFALLRSPTRETDDAALIVTEAFPQEDKQGSAILQPAQYPLMVHFDSLNTPKTATRDTTPVSEIKLEITKEPVTWGLGKLLPWLSNYTYQRLDGGNFGDEKAVLRFANSLTARDFSSEPGHK